MDAKVTARLPFEKYVSMPGVHATALRDILTSARLYNSRQFAERQDTNTLRLGRAGHTAVLEPDRFLLDYWVWKSEREDGTKRIRRGGEWDKACEVNAGKTNLTEEQYETALRMRDAVREHTVASKLLAEKGSNEITIEWTHDRTGLRCKSRVDRLCSALVDVKTTRDPSPAVFANAAGRYGYPMQLAFYREAARVAGLGDLPVKLLVVQNVEPFDVVIFSLAEEILAHGREQYELAMLKVALCESTKQWPGIAPDTELPLLLPAWASPDPSEEPLTFDGAAIF